MSTAMAKNDFIVGDRNFNAAPNMAPATGRVVVYSGDFTPGEPPVELFGRDAELDQEYLGTSVAGIGDVNDDGFDEVVASGPRQQLFIESTVYLYNMWSPEVNYPPLP